jgi:hypothetical protein
MLSLLFPVLTIFATLASKFFNHEEIQETGYYDYRFILLVSAMFPVIYINLKERLLLITSLLGGFLCLALFWWDIYGFPGEEAIDVTASQVVIAGGPDNLCIGGSGVLLGTNDWTAGGAAVRLRVNGSVRYADDAELERGLDGDGGAYGPLVFYALGTTGVVEIAEQAIRPTLAVLSPTAAPGQVLAVDASGDAGALHFVFASSKALLPIALPGTGMHVHADPGSALIVVPLLLDAIGSGGFAVPLPANPALAGVELILQSIDGDLSTLRVSNPALFTITP